MPEAYSSEWFEIVATLAHTAIALNEAGMDETAEKLLAEIERILFVY